MNIKELQQLYAEKATLEKLLAELSESSVIERMSLESRKKEVEDTLASQSIPSRQPIKTRLTFSGKPIVGSYGMFAEFAAAVVDAFAGAVTAVGASQSHSVKLGARGVIPNRDSCRMLITGTAPGSFGFELEEAPVAGTEMLFPDLSLVESAIEQTKAIMQASIGTDDELADAISEIDPRALEALKKFLKTMADQEAVCTLKFKDESFQFKDVGQIRRSESRLSQDNIHEEDKELIGEFLGVLPMRRTFEFKITESNEVISGKVGPEIEDASEINHKLDKSLKVRMHTKRVGSGRPRYTLAGYQEMANQEGN